MVTKLSALRVVLATTSPATRSCHPPVLSKGRSSFFSGIRMTWCWDSTSFRVQCGFPHISGWRSLDLCLSHRFY